MSADHEAPQPKLDSEAVIDDIIATSFEISQANLDPAQLAEQITKNVASAHTETTGTTVVSLVGGAASGKTTLSKSIVGGLVKSGLASDTISTDDFVVGDRAYRHQRLDGKHPKSKYNFALMNEKIAAIRSLANDKQVKVPTYDEATGVAADAGEQNYTHAIGKVDVLIIEGDFPTVDRANFVIFLHVPDERRLQHRLARDPQTRSESDSQKIIDNFNLRQKTQHHPVTLTAAPYANLLIRGHSVGNELKFDIYKAKT